MSGMAKRCFLSLWLVRSNQSKRSYAWCPLTKRARRTAVEKRIVPFTALRNITSIRVGLLICWRTTWPGPINLLWWGPHLESRYVQGIQCKELSRNIQTYVLAFIFKYCGAGQTPFTNHNEWKLCSLWSILVETDWEVRIRFLWSTNYRSGFQNKNGESTSGESLAYPVQNRLFLSFRWIMDRGPLNIPFSPKESQIPI